MWLLVPRRHSVSYLLPIAHLLSSFSEHSHIASLVINLFVVYSTCLVKTVLQYDILIHYIPIRKFSTNFRRKNIPHPTGKNLAICPNIETIVPVPLLQIPPIVDIYYHEVLYEILLYKRWWNELLGGLRGSKSCRRPPPIHRNRPRHGREHHSKTKRVVASCRWLQHE